MFAPASRLHWQYRLQADEVIETEKHWLLLSTSRKYAYIILTPLNHFYTVKLWFTGVYIIFSYFCLFINIDYGYSLEPPHRGGSNKYLQSMFWAEIWKKISDFFYLKIFIFCGKIFSIFE